MQRFVKLMTKLGEKQSQEHWLFAQDTPPFLCPLEGFSCYTQLFQVL